MMRAAIVGLGRWGRALVGSVHDTSDEIAFVSAHTRTRAPAEEFCRARHIAMADSYEEILSDPNVDAVVLATPHSQHEEQVLKAAAAGKHVFVEKPITLQRASADHVVEATRQAGVQLAVGFCRRFHPSLEEVRTRLRDGRLGALVGLVGQQTSGTGAFMAAENWRLDPDEAPGGAMTAVGVHLLDHMIELAGPVTEVHCVTGRHGLGIADDTTMLLLRFKSGITGTIFCSTATTPNFTFTIYGTKGLAEISRTDLQSFRFVPAPDRAPDGPVVAPAAEMIEHPGFSNLRAELTAFARSVRTKTPFPVAIDEVLHGMSVFDALVESARSGQPVRVPSA